MADNIADKLSNLVTDFRLANFRGLNEWQTRQTYIEPFWEILGWNVRKQSEVQGEKTESSKRPDYRFRKDNKTLFFVEAKKPNENLKENQNHIYQAKIYCWNGKVPLAVLTDFEEFRPFRAYGLPKKDDREKGIIKQFDMKCEEYPDRAYDLLNTFGKEAVYGGSLNEIIQKPTQVELRDTVDKHFLITLTKWRTDLAAQIAKINKFANEFDLAEAVQRILDRLVFLRVLQDRDIETEDFMCGISKSKTDEPYSAFLKICKAMAPKYNGLIFNPHPLSENLKIEGRLFKKIVQELDFEESPYRFDEIPVEMLGTIYERFLGDEISFSPRGKLVIDKKPEVRKAGGVYYTPQYIVEYIVQNTVGKLLEICKTPEDVAKLKILDPACGSGSFLLGAFNLLIKWHEDYFSANPTKIIEKTGKQYFNLAYLDDNNITKLTAKMKGRILQNNLYGVDLDKQATEVAQMSLYIRVLEGLTGESIMQLGFHEALLPRLDGNIKCGNSLIGPDFINEGFFKLPEREKHKINPFDWEEQFPFIKEKGGFDAVIGNPPYLRVQGLQEYHSNIIQYLKNYYKSASTGNFDIYVIFIEKGFSLLNDRGYFGFIVPHKFFPSQFGENIRELITSKNALEEIVHFGSNKVFEQADTYTCLLFLSKKKNKEFKIIEFGSGADLESELNLIAKSKNKESNKFKIGFINHPEKSKDKWSFKSGETGGLIDKLLNSNFPKLNEITEKIFVGLQTSADDIYVLKVKDNKYLNYKNLKSFKLFSKSLNEEVEIEKGLIKPFLMGRDVYRYDDPIFRNYVIFPYTIINNSAVIMAKENIKEKFPNGWHYLLENRKVLEGRENGKMNHDKFYAYIYPKNLAYFEQEKILIRELGDKPNMFFDNENFYHTAKIYSLLLKDKSNLNYLYMLGILNSKILNFFIKNTSEIWGTSHKFKTQFLNPFPIPNLTDRKVKIDMVSLVDRMLKLHKDKQTASDFDRKQIDQYIAKTDKEIDKLVYELYTLTEEEIKVVEGI
ncbi:MAG: hypothetical protein A2X61_06015 [Ignavibacteria bacterium GWB2_35_12]|nr:MAG: hypothetical protein A2X63_07010 [Ignavibacteria bacterium GWA2_35_8]OGU39809.1 MAG: hypothetical protein A2X61_06015 [Ignavibacteria bacterium GWB2_35_12]OGU95153.1 MAG: hypothetical protein A2220_03265 [Ignavibacteria bacterium RIFOXYA2_FULL_35_10]OGV21439.1 MAG: hypothetical protein A2475_13595 [Ignavibacteria bacterium RIFOXYC2_FULL_35_21]